MEALFFMAFASYVKVIIRPLLFAPCQVFPIIILRLRRTICLAVVVRSLPLTSLTHTVHCS